MRIENDDVRDTLSLLSDFEVVPMGQFMATIETNSLGPLLVSRALAENLVLYG